jgi:hypothetical protein
MNIPDEVRWRLRDGTQIVGYERHIDGRVWSSKDGLWWRGQPLKYSEKDRCLGAKDINNQWLFEQDVVTWEAQSSSWLLTRRGDQWVLQRENQVIAAPLQDRTLRRVAFAFVKSG